MWYEEHCVRISIKFQCLRREVRYKMPMLTDLNPGTDIANPFRVVVDQNSMGSDKSPRNNDRSSVGGIKQDTQCVL